jgi:hypothetical protein
VKIVEKCDLTHFWEIFCKKTIDKSTSDVVWCYMKRLYFLTEEVKKENDKETIRIRIGKEDRNDKGHDQNGC